MFLAEKLGSIFLFVWGFFRQNFSSKSEADFLLKWSCVQHVEHDDVDSIAAIQHIVGADIKPAAVSNCWSSFLCPVVFCEDKSQNLMK